MPDPDIGQLPAFPGSPHGVGEAQVGVADHAEHVRDPERDQRLDQHVADRAGARRRGRNAHVDAVRPVGHLVRGNPVGKALWGRPVSGS